MRDTFEEEIMQFKHHFRTFKNKRIVLYGIGRKTATLTAHDIGFHFVGLLDREANNIGKSYYGLPVISIEEAERIADIIIINAPATYWEIIYKRIKDTLLPVYYLNGRRAYLPDRKARTNHPYWNLSLSHIENRIDEYDIITFDMYDTLVTRVLPNPTDVFALVTEIIREKTSNREFDYGTIRNTAINSMDNKCYTYSELMKAIKECGNADEELLHDIEKTELNLEHLLLRGRKQIQDLLELAREKGKEIFVITDMYLPKEMLRQWLLELGTDIDAEHFIISSEERAEKKDGSLWAAFRKKKENSRILHIGDDPISDVEQPVKYEIDAIRILSVNEMVLNSSLNELLEISGNIYQGLLAGSIAVKLFGNNPFCISKDMGLVVINDAETLGYCFFGDVILSFCAWLAECGKEQRIDYLYFLSRDGYLIKKDYTEFCRAINDEAYPQGEYLYASRRMAYIAAINTEKDFEEWVNFPFRGNYDDFLENRFSISNGTERRHKNDEIQLPYDREKVRGWINEESEPIRVEIHENLRREKNNYSNFP